MGGGHFVGSPNRKKVRHKKKKKNNERCQVKMLDTCFYLC